MCRTLTISRALCARPRFHHLSFSTSFYHHATCPRCVHSHLCHSLDSTCCCVYCHRATRVRSCLCRLSRSAYFCWCCCCACHRQASVTSRISSRRGRWSLACSSALWRHTTTSACGLYVLVASLPVTQIYH
ncbi:hypothetical protein BJV78DRAFT_229125 [Lactifluus subvellereus]|nr:hypothetical protein BJV78DRAFT_229125 [Lactifluus subvellereus]